MIRFIPGLVFLAAASIGPLQQIAVETNVVNIEVPVRVFQGGRFVDDLKIGDFELLQDGRIVPLEAVYRVKKQTVERREELQPFNPRTYRSFYLLFEISDYSPRLGQALEYFMQNVIMPGDTLTVVTPIKTYRMKPRAFEVRARAEIVQQIIGILRHDALVGSSDYRGIVADLEDLAKTIGSSLSQASDVTAQSLSASGSSQSMRDFPIQDLLNHYGNMLGMLENVRTVDEKRILQFSRVLKDDPSQKSVFMFYQREFIPKIDPRLLYTYIDLYQDQPNVNETIQGIFEFYHRDISFNVENLKRAFADASAAVHFLLINEPNRQIPGVVYEEQSEDIFGAFSQIAQASGGFTESSANPLALMKNAVEASENYYLLYYAPRPYVKDGKFHSLTVRVKRPGVRVIHRLGYVAD